MFNMHLTFPVEQLYQQLYQQLSLHCCEICLLLRSARYAGLRESFDGLGYLVFLSFTITALPSCLWLVLLTSSVSCSHFTKDYLVSVDHELLAPGIQTCHLPMEKGSHVWLLVKGTGNALLLAAPFA